MTMRSEYFFSYAGVVLLLNGMSYPMRAGGGGLPPGEGRLPFPEVDIPADIMEFQFGAAAVQMGADGAAADTLQVLAVRWEIEIGIHIAADGGHFQVDACLGREGDVYFPADGGDRDRLILIHFAEGDIDVAADGGDHEGACDIFQADVVTAFELNFVLNVLDGGLAAFGTIPGNLQGQVVRDADLIARITG